MASNLFELYITKPFEEIVERKKPSNSKEYRALFLEFLKGSSDKPVEMSPVKEEKKTRKTKAKPLLLSLEEAEVYPSKICFYPIRIGPNKGKICGLPVCNEDIVLDKHDLRCEACLKKKGVTKKAEKPVKTEGFNYKVERPISRLCVVEKDERFVGDTGDIENYIFEKVENDTPNPYVCVGKMNGNNLEELQAVEIMQLVRTYKVDYSFKKTFHAKKRELDEEEDSPIVEEEKKEKSPIPEKKKEKTEKSPVSEKSVKKSPLPEKKKDSPIPQKKEKKSKKSPIPEKSELSTISEKSEKKKEKSPLPKTEETSPNDQDIYSETLIKKSRNIEKIKLFNGIISK